ncbi:MAG: DNA-processing protein DprA [Bacteroidota bacterium]|nr:DNA-processing protein DprA [Bacteroidota bacterium]
MSRRTTSSLGQTQFIRMIAPWPLSDDTNVTLLLCAWFGGEQEHKPLTLTEYNLLATWLHQNEYRPKDLVRSSCIENAAKESNLGYRRISGLLERRITLGFHLEEWQRRDYWILGRGDAGYPKRLKQSMKSQAPPVLFGTGEVAIIDQGGTAIVGPEGAMQQSVESVRQLATFYAQIGHAIIIAGRQSIGENAAKSAMAVEGSVLWVLQGSELFVPLAKPLRRSRATGQTVLLSSRSPADKRSLGEEPHVGQMLMTLCDSVVYVDSSEISTDRYCVESALPEFLGSRRCFVHVSGEPTETAFQLINSGAEFWKQELIKVRDEAPEVQPEVIEDSPETSDVRQHEPTQADDPDPEIKLSESAKPQSVDPEGSLDEENASEAVRTEADVEVRQESEEETVDDRENFALHGGGTQGELFELDIESIDEEENMEEDDDEPDATEVTDSSSQIDLFSTVTDE